MLSDLLIKEISNDFDFDLKYEKLNQIPLKQLVSLKNKNMDLIENINDKNYSIQNNEIKYKIFEDISSISKNKNNLELVLSIPSGNNIISVNKIKLSNKLNEYIKDIYVKINDNIIMTRKEIFDDNKKILKIIEPKENKTNINHSTNINIHIIFNKNTLNHIINKNIFVNYSYMILKNKLKFI